MPEFSYPFVFVYPNCEGQTTIEQTDALDLHTNPDSLNAVEIALQKHGWIRDNVKGILWWCPDCGGAKESNGQ